MADNDDNISSPLRDCLVENLQIGGQIGRGANGRILEAKWEGIVVAVKEIHSIFMNEVSDGEFQSFKQNFLRECEQSSRIRHPNVVRFLGIYNPSGAKVPSLVMERLHSDLTSLLKENPSVPVGIKLSIIKDVALGLRYLHTRNPPIIHRDLSSNNVLLSKGMEGKIGDLGTARLVDARRQSKITKAPGTIDFMPPEALEDVANVFYGKELDIFSIGCVMLHTLSHQWPTPLQAAIINPETGIVTGGRSEVERRCKYFKNIVGSRSNLLIPLIESCLSNLPKNRPSIVRVCDQLEGQLADRERVSINESTMSTLQQELQQKEIELQKKDSEIKKKDIEIESLTTTLQDKEKALEMLKSKLSKSNLQITPPHLPPKQVNKSSSDFWNKFEVTWQQCDDLPNKSWVTSVAELDGKIYATLVDNENGYYAPFTYDCNNDKWSSLPALSLIKFSLVTVPDTKQLLAIGGMVNNNGVFETSNKVFLWEEKNRKWSTPFPHMPTARCRCSSASHGSTVIVAGGITCCNRRIITRVVEVLHIKERNNSFTKSSWSVIEQLPHTVWDAIPLIFNEKLYITQGYETDPGTSTCSIVYASLPELLQSSNKNTSYSGQVWKKLPDMPYSSYSINHFQGHLITFTGGYKVEQPDEGKAAWQSVPLIYIYNPHTKTWDCVGETTHGYLLGRSVHIMKNKILFMGGLTGKHKGDDTMRTCSILTLSPW